MSSTGVRESNDTNKRVIKGLILNEAQFIQSLRIFANTSTLSGLGATEGEINNSPIEASGNYLSRLGDTMLGPFALSPPLDFTIEIDTNNTIDIGPLNDNAQYTSNVQLDSIQPNGFVLDIIANAAFDGQLLFLRTFAPTTPFTISQGTLGNGGNIQTGDGNDLTVGDLQTVTLIFDEALKIEANTGGSWRILSVSSGSSSGGGEFFGPWTADHNAGTFDLTNLDRLRLVSDSNVPVSSGDPSIFLDVGGFMNLNVASNNGIRIKSNDVEIARFQSSTQIGLIMGTNADIRLEGNELFLDTTDTSFIDANTPNSLRLTTNSTVALTIGTASIIPSRDIIFSNILSNVLKMSGKDLFLDVDNDTLIDSTTDDSLRFTVGGSPRLTITNIAILPTHDISFTNALSNVLRMQGKDIFLDADNDSSIDSVNDDSIRFITGGSPRLTISNTAILPTSDISFTNALTHVLKMNGKAIFLDTDNDSSISSVSDDSIQIATGGSLELSITNGFVTVPNSLIINGNTTLGDSSADNITFNGDTVGNITANVDNTDSIGVLSRTYAFGFFKGGIGVVEGYATGFKPSGQTNTGIVFTVPTAGGKTELRCSFQTGVSQIIVTEP